MENICNVEVFLILTITMMPGYLGDDNLTVKTTDSVPPYHSDLKDSQLDSTTSSKHKDEKSVSSTPKGTPLDTPILTPSDQYPPMSSPTNRQDEIRFSTPTKHLCLLTLSSRVETDYEEYGSSENVYIQQTNAHPNVVNFKQRVIEFHEEISETRHENNDIFNAHQTLNPTKIGNFFHTRSSKEHQGTVSSFSGAAKLFVEHTTAEASWGTDSSSTQSAIQDSFTRTSMTFSINTPKTTNNYCDAGSPTDSIRLDNCPSCQGRCGQVGTVSKLQVLCSCDRTCMVYQDCCPDFESLCSDQFNLGLIIQKSMSASWDSKCVTLLIDDGRVKSKEKFLFISECDGTKYDLAVTHGIPPTKEGVPVEDMTTGLFFINYDCAKCHGARKLRPMQITSDFYLKPCKEDLAHPYPDVNGRPSHTETLSRGMSADRKSTDTDPDKTAAGMEASPQDINTGESQTLIPLLISSGTIFSISYEFVGEPARRCYDKLLDRCSDSCSNNKLAELCLRSGFMYTTSRETGYEYVTFKNVYCAICHTRSDHLTCGDLKYFGSIPYNPQVSAFSLSILFDFNNGPSVGSVGIICDEDQVILPNGIACGDTVCPDGYILQHDTCAPLNTPQTFSWDFRYQITINTSLGCALCENNTMVNFDDAFQLIATDVFTIVRNGCENISITSIEISCSCKNILIINISIQIVPPQNANYLLTNITQKLQIEGAEMVLNYLLNYMYEANGTAYFSRVTFVAFNTTPLSSEWEHPCVGYLIRGEDFSVQGTELVLHHNGDIYHEGEYIIQNGSAFICRKSVRQGSDAAISAVLANLTMVLSTLSFACILIRIILQFTTDKYNNGINRMQFHLSLALCLSTGLLLMSPLASSNEKVCSILASVKYFSYMASFAWMTCIAGDTFSVLKKSNSCIQDNPDRSVIKYSLISWIIPLKISGLVLGLDHLPIPMKYKPQLGGSACWITNNRAILACFVAPISVCITINMIFYILANVSLWKMFRDTNRIRQTKDKTKEFRIYLKLFILMGVTWVIGIAAPWADNPAVWFLFVIFNASQGIFIFLAFVFDFRIFRHFTRRCCPCMTHGDPTDTVGPSANNSSGFTTTQITRAVDTEQS